MSCKALPSSSSLCMACVCLCVGVLVLLNEVNANYQCQPSPYNMDLRHEGCQSTVIQTRTCKGLCSSHSEPALDGTGKMVDHCKCCIPRAMESQNITLECAAGMAPVVMRVPRATRCKCRVCSSPRTQT